MLDANSKLVNKRGVNSVGLNPVKFDESDANHWLWRQVNRLKRSIHSMLEREPDNHSEWHKEHLAGVDSEANRLRRDYSDDHEDNEVDVVANKDQHSNDDEDDVDIDDDDDDVAGSGFLYEEATDLYSLKPSRLCEYRLFEFPTEHINNKNRKYK